MAANENPDVGYGRPPTHGRFKKGTSGNPAGRAKGVKNLKTDLVEELAELVSVRDGRRAYEVSKQRAIVKALVAAAVKGDSKAAAAVFALCVRVLGVGEDDEPEGALSAKDQRVGEEFIEREVARRLMANAPEAPHEE
jgi:hypothetical protein